MSNLGKKLDHAPHPTWSYKETMERINSFSGGTHLQLFYGLQYLTGGRLGEVLAIKPQDIILKGKLLHISKPVLKRRKQMNREQAFEREHEEYYVTMAWNIKLQCEKYGYKNVKEWVGRGRQQIQEQATKVLGCTTHSLRHLRATHMGKGKIPGSIHKATPSYLKYFFGWSKISTASYYIDDLTIDDVLESYASDSTRVVVRGPVLAYPPRDDVLDEE